MSFSSTKKMGPTSLEAGLYYLRAHTKEKLKSNKTDATDVDVSYLFWLLTRNCKFKIVSIYNDRGSSCERVFLFFFFFLFFAFQNNDNDDSGAFHRSSHITRAYSLPFIYIKKERKKKNGEEENK